MLAHLYSQSCKSHYLYLLHIKQVVCLTLTCLKGGCFGILTYSRVAAAYSARNLYNLLDRINRASSPLVPFKPLDSSFHCMGEKKSLGNVLQITYLAEWMKGEGTWADALLGNSGRMAPGHGCCLFHAASAIWGHCPPTLSSLSPFHFLGGAGDYRKLWMRQHGVTWGPELIICFKQHAINHVDEHMAGTHPFHSRCHVS